MEVVTLAAFELQWGRAYSARRTGPVVPALSEEIIASMGPGLFSPEDSEEGLLWR